MSPCGLEGVVPGWGWRGQGDGGRGGRGTGPRYSIYLSIYLSSVQFFDQSIFSFTIYLTIFLSVNYNTNPSIYFSFTIYLSICNLQHQQIYILFAYESFLIITIIRATIFLAVYHLSEYLSATCLSFFYLFIDHILSIYLAFYYLSICLFGFGFQLSAYFSTIYLFIIYILSICL